MKSCNNCRHYKFNDEFGVIWCRKNEELVIEPPNFDKCGHEYYIDPRTDEEFMPRKKVMDFF